jgi:hypothetical protein
LLAPTTSKLLVPSARIMSESVVHTVGALNCTNGGRFTRRGAGRPVRPPVVCTKRAQESVTSGSWRMSGSGTGSNVVRRFARRTVVAPIRPPPE